MTGTGTQYKVMRKKEKARTGKKKKVYD